MDEKEKELAIPMFSVSEASQLLGLNAVTIRRWIKSGKLQGFWLGSHLRVKKSDITALITPTDTVLSIKDLAKETLERINNDRHRP
jgi:excisionase family DNA binding protein